jgi:hypothetical protein
MYTVCYTAHTLSIYGLEHRYLYKMQTIPSPLMSLGVEPCQMLLSLHSLEGGVTPICMFRLPSFSVKTLVYLQLYLSLKLLGQYGIFPVTGQE